MLIFGMERVTMTTLYEKALAFATVKHDGQLRKYTGEPYIMHPIAVAKLVKATGAREAVVAAALLHDVLEDTPTTVPELRVWFGDEVTELVIELTNVFNPGTGGNAAARKAKEAARLAATSADAQTIKVADILHNTPSIAKYDPGFARVYLPEKAALLAVLTKAHPTLLAKAKGVNR